MENDKQTASTENSDPLSDSTRQVYRASWRDFVGWCQSKGVPALPADPEAIAAFVRERDDLALSTIRSRISAIRHYHRDAGLDDPTRSLEVQDTWYKISEEKRSKEGRRSGAETAAGRTVPAFPPRQMLEEGVSLVPEHFRRAGGEEALERWEVTRETWVDEYVPQDEASARRLTTGQRRLIPEVDYDLPVLRDRALLLLMAAGGVRRSEVARLDVPDVFVAEDGTLCVGIRKKNGMPKRLLWVPKFEELHYCTARAVAAWILTAGLTEGPLFRSFDSHENLKRTRIALSSINYVLEQRAEEAGFDPDAWPTSRLRKGPES